MRECTLNVCSSRKLRTFSTIMQCNLSHSMNADGSVVVAVAYFPLFSQLFSIKLYHTEFIKCRRRQFASKKTRRKKQSARN